MFAWNGSWPDGGGVEAVQHLSDKVWLKQVSKPLMPAGSPDFVELLLTSEQMESALTPMIHDARWIAVNGNHCADQNVAIEQDEHQRLFFFDLAQARDSSTAASISS